MKKTVAALLSAVFITVFILTATYIAQASDSAQIDVSFTLVHEPTPPPAPSGPLYIVYIPAAISLNDKTDIFFTWENYGVTADKAVVVSIDGARTYVNNEGNLYLTSGSHRLFCSVDRGGYGTQYLERIYGPGDNEVAHFYGHTDSLYAVAYGRLVFTPTVHTTDVAGTYTGTVYFKIELITL